ncbi:MAG: hypothetical protein ACOC8F_06595 [Planctomycetota bacterium]
MSKATLHLRLAKGHLREVAFCTLPCDWVEGKANYEPEEGSTCFTHVIYPTHTWPVMGSTRPPGRRGEDHERAVRDRARGGTMLDATFNSPQMRWETSKVEAGEDGWKHGRDPKQDDPIVTFDGFGGEQVEALKCAALRMLAAYE